jgi:ATP/ADP translocase
VTGQPESVRTTVRVAALCAFAMIATQIASKAVRDALFLSEFSIEALPLMVITSAVASLVFVLLASRLLNRLGPQRLVPASFLVSAVLLLAIALVNTALPRLTAAALYLHVAILGAILVSWFWSLLNEQFDARTGRRSVSRIAAGGTFGGLLGGLLAERVGTLWSPAALLPLLAGLHAVCALLSHRVALRSGAATATATDDDAGVLQGLRVLRRSPYLRNLGLLVLLGTVAATLIDFAFKAQATQAVGDSRSLVRFFAVFYAATAFLAFLVQTFLVSALLKTPQDLSRNVSLLPLVVAFGALLAIILPGLVVVTLARGLESIVRNSAFRSSYEIFFNPVAADDKRSSKTIIDVGFDRLGDFLGGLLVQAVVLVIGVALGLPILLGFAIAVSLLAVWRIRHLHGGYIAALEGVIRERVTPVPRDEQPQSSIELFRSQVTRLHPTLHSIELLQERSPAADPAAMSPDQEPEAPGSQHHVTGTSSTQSNDAARLQALQSRDPDAVRAALALDQPLRPEMIPAVITLLAWDLVYPLAARVLRHDLDQHAQQLIEAMLEPQTDFAIRRRIPAILSGARSEEIVAALQRALSDVRFEVRYQAALALARMHARDPQIRVDRRVVLDAITREAQVDQRMWNRRRLLDEVKSDSTPFYRDVLRNRTHRSLEHLFHILSLAFPAEPLRVAYDGLHTGDPVLRGTALEYLESILPREVRRSLWPLLGSQPQEPTGGKSEKELLDSLLHSHESILLQLKDLEKRMAPGKDSP